MLEISIKGQITAWPKSKNWVSFPCCEALLTPFLGGGSLVLGDLHTGNEVQSLKSQMNTNSADF